MTAAARLSDEAFDLDETPGDGIDGEEEAFERDGSEQRWPARSDEARSRDLASVDIQPHLGDGPDLSSSSRGLHGLLALRGELELVGDRARNDEKRRAGVDQHIDHRGATGRAGEASGDVE